MAKTKEEINTIYETLKPQFKPLYTLTIPVGDEGDDTRTIFLKKYDRATYAIVQKLISTSEYMKAMEVMLRNTWVGGDDVNEILNDIDMFRSCETKIAELLSVKTAELKKN